MLVPPREIYRLSQPKLGKAREKGRKSPRSCPQTPSGTGRQGQEKRVIQDIFGGDKSQAEEEK